jgi:FkbM family methyltransferase
MSRFTRKLARSIGHRIGSIVSFDHAALISAAIMEEKGIGRGSDTHSSGEHGVFRLLRAEPIVFDVGGHVGDYTAAFLRAHPRGQSFVFEPSADHFHLLTNSLGGLPNVKLNQFALGSRDAQLPLYKSGSICGVASLTKRRLDHFGYAMDIAETVSVRRLDDVANESAVQVIDLLKIDVEGHELDVLRGAMDMLRSSRIRLVQFEFGGCNLDTRTTLQDFFYFFKEVGFTLGIVQPGGTVQRLSTYNEFFEQYRTTNYLAAPFGQF